MSRKARNPSAILRRSVAIRGVLAVTARRTKTLSSLSPTWNLAELIRAKTAAFGSCLAAWGRSTMAAARKTPLAGAGSSLDSLTLARLSAFLSRTSRASLSMARLGATAARSARWKQPNFISPGLSPLALSVHW